MSRTADPSAWSAARAPACGAAAGRRHGLLLAIPRQVERGFTQGLSGGAAGGRDTPPGLFCSTTSTRRPKSPRARPRPARPGRNRRQPGRSLHPLFHVHGRCLSGPVEVEQPCTSHISLSARLRVRRRSRDPAGEARGRGHHAGATTAVLSARGAWRRPRIATRSPLGVDHGGAGTSEGWASSLKKAVTSLLEMSPSPCPAGTCASSRTSRRSSKSGCCSGSGRVVAGQRLHLTARDVLHDVARRRVRAQPGIRCRHP